MLLDPKYRIKAQYFLKMFIWSKSYILPYDANNLDTKKFGLKTILVLIGSIEFIDSVNSPKLLSRTITMSKTSVTITLDNTLVDDGSYGTEIFDSFVENKLVTIYF